MKKYPYLFILTSCILFLASSVAADAATYHVRQGGGGDCSGVQECLDRLQPGDTLLVHAGTYAEGNFNLIPSGTSVAPVTVAAAPGERAVIRPPPGTDGIHLTGYAGTDVAFIVIDGLVFDCSAVETNCIKFESYETQIHDVIFQNNEVFGNPRNNGIVGVGGERIKILNNDVHDNGLIPQDITGLWCGYGMYIAGVDMLIAGNRVHHNGGWGIHHYTSGGGARNDVIAGNYVYNNGLACSRSDGIILASGDNTQAYNNVVFNNLHTGIGVVYGSNSKAINNTVFNNGGFGIEYGEGSNAEIVNNISFNNAGGDIVDAGGLQGTLVLSNNLTSDPNFVNGSASDFRLTAGSSAIDAGVQIPGVTDGFLGSAPDIGACEYGDSDCRRWGGGNVPPSGSSPRLLPAGSAGLRNKGSSASPAQVLRSSASNFVFTVIFGSGLSLRPRSGHYAIDEKTDGVTDGCINTLVFGVVRARESRRFENPGLYSNVVRAQLSTGEMSLLFYTGLSDLGNNKFKPLIERFSLLEGLDKNPWPIPRI